MAGQRILMFALLLFAASAAAQDDEPPVDEPAPVEAPPADVPPAAEAAPAPEAVPADSAAKHAATVVYKCTNQDGSVVFSEEPCSADPAKVETVDTSSALRTGSGGHQAEIAASVADNDCRDRAYKSTHDDTQVAESNRHIAEYEQRRQDLQSQPAYASGANAGADDNAPSDDVNADTAVAPPPDNSQAIAEIDAAIAKEREFQAKAEQGSDAAYQAALRACDEQLQRASQPPPAEPPPAAPQDVGGG
jgi:hypothetical protein